METTYHSSERASFFTFFWTVFLTTALGVLITWLCGAYVYDFARPGNVQLGRRRPTRFRVQPLPHA